MRKKFDFPHATLHAYLEDKTDRALRDELIGRAIPVVRHTARMIMCRKRIWLPQHVDEDELVSEGLVKLTPIVEGFDPPRRKNLPWAFHMHVSRRLQWRLMDYVRSERLVSRGTVNYAMRFKVAFNALLAETGSAPTIDEVAGRLRISVKRAAAWRVLAMELDVRNASIDRDFLRADGFYKSLSLHDMLVDVSQQTPEERDAGFFALLPPSLTDIERAIVISMYRDNKTMIEIGSAFGFSESRISQIFSGILPRIRAAYFERLRKENGECDE